MTAQATTRDWRKDAEGIRLVRIKDMYGTCKAIKLLRDGEEIGDSYFSAGEMTWYVSACGYETKVKVDPPSQTEEEMHSAVELTLRLQVSAADAIKSARAA